LQNRCRHELIAPNNAFVKYRALFFKRLALIGSSFGNSQEKLDLINIQRVADSLSPGGKVQMVGK
jgi:hypothetical protein